MDKKQAVQELRRMFWDVRVEKRDQGNNAKYMYHTLEDVEDLVLSILKEKDLESKYWYVICNFCVYVYHNDIDEPIRKVTIPKEWFDKTDAGKVTIMSPEQRVMSQMTFSARECLRKAFFIRSVHDADGEFSKMTDQDVERKLKIEMRKVNHLGLIDGIKTQERIDGARDSLKNDQFFSDEQKKELSERIDKREKELQKKKV